MGKLKDDTLFVQRCKRILVGLGFQEIMSAILSSNKVLCENMLAEESVIEIENVMSENYSAVRNWIIPSLLYCLTKNMHVEYPQNIFELDECVVLDEESIDNTKTANKIAAAVSGIDIGYENISSYLDAFLSSLGLSYQLEKTDHNSFIQGRVAKIIVDNKEVGIIGELHPQVLNNWGLGKAVAVFELNANALFGLCKK